MYLKRLTITLKSMNLPSVIMVFCCYSYNCKGTDLGISFVARRSHYWEGTVVSAVTLAGIRLPQVLSVVCRFGGCGYRSGKISVINEAK